MRKFVFLALISLLTIAMQCKTDNTNLTFEEEKKLLTELKLEIENLANTSVCNDSTECKFIAFGSKPCGGPWQYLIYSTSIDTDKLEDLVGNYNQKEDDFNRTWNVVSDCSFALPPTNINCENNTCVAVY